MPFSINEYEELRPFLYHVTAHENLPRLARLRRLDPASALLQAAGRLDLLRVRRGEPVTLRIEEETVVLKDQKPLVGANVALAPGWEFGDLVEYVNSHVFFWPGDALAAVASGQRLLAHYSPESPLLLRMRLRDVLRTNPGIEPLFCPYNSGAPRMNRGRPIPRGPSLFRRASACPRKRHEVVEVGFKGSVVLPEATEIAAGGDLWSRLFTPAT